MKNNFLSKIIILFVSIFIISGTSMGGDKDEDYKKMMEMINKFDACGDKQGKTIRFKTKYMNSEIFNASGFAFCASSTTDCIEQLNEHLKKREPYIIQDNEKVILTSDEIMSITSEYCAIKFPSSK